MSYLAFAYRQCPLFIREHIKRSKLMTIGLGAATVFTVGLCQYRAMVRCKNGTIKELRATVDTQNIQMVAARSRGDQLNDDKIAEQNKVQQLGREKRCLEDDLLVKDGTITQLRTALDESFRNNANLTHEVEELRTRVKSMSSMLFEVSARCVVWIRRARSQARLNKTLETELDKMEAEQQAQQQRSAAAEKLSVAAANRFAQLAVEESRAPQESSNNPFRKVVSPNVVTMGSIKPAAPTGFVEPVDFMSISTASPPLAVPVTIEMWKAHLRERRNKGDKDVPPEFKLVAEAKYWLGKNRVPTSWLSIPVSPELANKFAIMDSNYRNPKRARKQEQGKPSHTNGEVTHHHGGCPTPTLSDAMGTASTSVLKVVPNGKKSSEQTKAPMKASPGPPVMTEPLPKVLLTQVQQEQMAEAKAHQASLVTSGVIQVTVADKVAKSKRDKAAKLAKPEDADDRVHQVQVADVEKATKTITVDSSTLAEANKAVAALLVSPEAIVH